MKRRNKSILLILTTLLQLQIPCILKAQESQIPENVVSLREDQPAPGDGYWTEPQTFRQILTDVKQGKLYKTQFEQCVAEKAQVPSDHKELWFAAGSATTILFLIGIGSILKSN